MTRVVATGEKKLVSSGINGMGALRVLSDSHSKGRCEVTAFMHDAGRFEGAACKLFPFSPREKVAPRAG